MNSTQQWQSVTWFEVDEHQDGQRIDNFLFSRLKGVPKSRIYRLIREGQVRVNKNALRPKPNWRLATRIRVAPIRYEQKMNQKRRFRTRWLKVFCHVWYMKMKA